MKVVTLGLAVLMSCVAVAQQPTPEEQQAVARFFQVFQERSAPLVKDGNLLGQLELVRELHREHASNAGVQDFTRQLLGTFYSFLGRDQLALEQFDAQPADRAERAKAPSLDGFTPVPAVDAVVEAARGARAVFVNEAHHVARHRVLTMELLAPLYAQGYRYFAAETFAATDAELNTRGYPSRATGFYSREPIFGALVREALRVGYTLVQYEPENPADQDARETGQARNLYERVFAKDPEAKVLVHAGYDHINESGGLGGVPAMAERFREISGLDPLTIDQTTMRERSAPEFEGPFYRETEAAHRFTVPTVFATGGEVWSLRPGSHDMTVFMPRTAYVDGRPAWLADLGRRAVRVPSEACTTPPCAVFAWREADAADAVPVDALLVDRVEHAGTPPTLMLPPGDYRLESRDASGRVLHAWNARVEPAR